VVETGKRGARNKTKKSYRSYVNVVNDSKSLGCAFDALTLFVLSDFINRPTLKLLNNCAQIWKP
jgi:hypothetical protein